MYRATIFYDSCTLRIGMVIIENNYGPVRKWRIEAVDLFCCSLQGSIVVFVMVEIVSAIQAGYRAGWMTRKPKVLPRRFGKLPLRWADLNNANRLYMTGLQERSGWLYYLRWAQCIGNSFTVHRSICDGEVFFFRYSQVWYIWVSITVWKYNR